MHGSTSKIPSKNSRQQRCAEGFNSGVKGVMPAKQKDFCKNHWRIQVNRKLWYNTEA
jgi:hypothetical protein